MVSVSIYYLRSRRENRKKKDVADGGPKLVEQNLANDTKASQMHCVLALDT